MGIAMAEVIIILILLFSMVVAAPTGIFFLIKYLTGAGGKTCPHCAEKIKEAAKICRYCHMDVANVEIEDKPPKGFFQ
jgi:hypothetical protein